MKPYKPFSSYVFLLCTFWFCSATSIAFPHALHPDSMDRHAEITFTPNRFIVIYQVICGLNPTHRFSKQLDADSDGAITDAERTAFVEKIANRYAAKQILQFGDQLAAIDFHSGDAYASTGHNGMHVIKIDIAYIGNYPTAIQRGRFIPFRFEDENFKGVPGWKQMQVSLRDEVEYEGHIPYQEYKPFDYEIIATKGFTPATDRIQGSVKLPASGGTTETQVILPEKIEAPEVRYQADAIVTTITYILGGVMVLILILAAMTGFRQWKSVHRHDE